MEEADRLGVRVEKIILFGSRARGNHREDSDWDVLIVVESTDRVVRGKLWRGVHRRLVRVFRAPVDLVVVSSSYWRNYKDTPGTVLYPAMREGVVIE